MIVYLLQGVSLGLSAAASPGPFQAYVIAQTLKNGWRRTLLAALAPLVSDGPIIALTLLLLSNFPALFLRIIQVGGGVFVIYLAYKSFLAFRRFEASQVMTASAGRQSLLQAAAMNFLSPGPYLFWSLLAGPTLLRGWRETPGNGLGFIFGFYIALIGGMAMLIVLFGAARQMGPRVNRTLLGLSALALCAFGAYQLWQGLLGA